MKEKEKKKKEKEEKRKKREKKRKKRKKKERKKKVYMVHFSSLPEVQILAKGMIRSNRWK